MRAICLGLIFCLTSCSFLNSQNENLNAPEYELSKTGAGIVTGTALGAGLGAIIGSATGDAGAGLVLGAFAGAATGGIVGNQFQERDEKLASMRNEVRTLNEENRAQRQRINALSEEMLDQIEKKNRPSKSYGRSSLDSYQGNPQAKPLAKSSVAGGEKTTYANGFSYRSPDAGPSFLEKSLSTQERAQLKDYELPKSSREIKRQRKTERLGDLVPQDFGQESVKTMKPTLPAAKKPIKKPIIKNEASTLEIPPAKNAKTGEVVQEEDLMAYDYQQTQRSAGGAIVSIREQSKRDYASSPRCVDAEAEAKRARTSDSDADRLYYYSRALKLCPESSQYHLEAGKVYADIGRKEDAEMEFRQAIDLDPDNVEAQRALDLLG